MTSLFEQDINCSCGCLNQLRFGIGALPPGVPISCSACGQPIGTWEGIKRKTRGAKSTVKRRSVPADLQTELEHSPDRGGWASAL
jgi:hypothetical protein